MIDFLNIQDKLYTAVDAWDDIPSLTLSKSWLKLLGKKRITVGAESVADYGDETC